MISWLKGEIIDNWRNGTRSGVTIAISGIGYDIQILTRDQSSINAAKEATLWIHQVQKEDGAFLIGFKNKDDRNFFRKLVSINGIGPQLAISLLEKNQAFELITAIKNKEISTLKACAGVGKRTAERLIIELEHKLYDLPQQVPESRLKKEEEQKSNFNIKIVKEVKSALTNLDYENSEIDKALQDLELDYQSKTTCAEEKKKNFEKLDFEVLLRKTLLIINK